MRFYEIPDTNTVIDLTCIASVQKSHLALNINFSNGGCHYISLYPPVDTDPEVYTDDRFKDLLERWKTAVEA